jgi:hypothetical protein
MPAGKGLRRINIPKASSASLLLCAALCLCLLASRPSRAQAGGVAEYDVKAAFLYDFAKFVEWPANALPQEKSSIILCIVGADPFGAALDNTIRNQRIDRHEIVIRRTNKSEELRTCQIVFISRTEGKYLEVILDSLKGASTLVVGEGQGFAERGGAIEMYIEDKSVHFAINVDVLKRAHLEVSSNVLTLATIVHDKNPLRVD